jgi:hypothetical protein
VTATARPDGSVSVAWQPGSKRPERFQVLLNGPTPALVAQVPGANTSAVITSVKPGTTGTFFVLGVPPGFPKGAGLPTSPASNEITTFTRPGAPAGFKMGRAKFDNGRLYLFMRFEAAPANGRDVTEYRIRGQASNGATFSQDGVAARMIGRDTATFYTCNAACLKKGITVTAEIFAVNAAGVGPVTTMTYTQKPIDFPFFGGAVVPVPVGIPSLLTFVTGLVITRRRRRRKGKP